MGKIPYLETESAVTKELTIDNKALIAKLTTLAVVISVGLGLTLAFSDNEQQRQIDLAQATAEDAARSEAERAAFASLSPAQAFEECRQSWEASLSLSHYYLPTALAWSRQGLDGYYLQGVDASSLRHFHCDADGSVLRGKRYVRPDMEVLPAESTKPNDDSAASDPIKDWLAGQNFSPDLVALELYFAPDQNMRVRRWQGAEQLQAISTPPEAKFPLLLQAPLPSMHAEVPLQALTAHNWLREPAAALALLAAQLPENAKVMKLRFDENEIEVTIEGPIPAFDKDPPAPSGDMEFDEYGIADLSWWYPRPLFPGGCQHGESLSTVTNSFSAQFEAHINYSWLIYNCAKGWQMKQPKY